MMSYLTSISEVIWFFLPAYIANLAPIFAAHYRWLEQLNRPVDQDRLFYGQRLLGDNKTIRGFAVGILFGSIMGFLQYVLITSELAPPISLAQYATPLSAILLGAWLGFGALLGDAIKSFFKRRLNITPGASWIPWDQIDIVIGVVLVTWWFVPYTLAHLASALLIIGLGMFLFSAAGVALNIKKSL